MEIIGIILGFLLFNIFWLATLVRSIRDSNDYLGQLVLHYFACLAVCFIIGCIFMMSSHGCHGKLCELDYLINALAMDAVVYFIWSIVMFARSFSHIDIPTEPNTAKQKLGDGDLLDD